MKLKKYCNNRGSMALRGVQSNIALVLLLLLLICSCTSVVQQEDDTDDDNGQDNSAWLIPSEDVYVGAGRDEIASIDNPSFKKVSEIDFLDPDELVLGLKIGDEVKAYPNVILYYHEIVNDKLSDSPVSVTYCPLTGSGLAWNRVIDGEITTFGVSGLIYKNNLIAYDRKTESNWSQMKALSVKGPLAGQEPETYQLLEMTWETWKEAFPNSKVLAGNETTNFNYERYPYGGDYPSNNGSILFPIEREDDRLERKTLAHGLYYKSTLTVLPIKDFPNEISVNNMQVKGSSTVVIGSSDAQFVTSYSSVLDDGTQLKFEKITGQLPVVMKDDEGTTWNIFGEAVSGPREGEKLNRIPSYNAYWFAWVDFFGAGPREPFILRP